MGVYSEGSLKYSKELAIGADHITRDLAIGLRTSLATAEKIKIAHGFAHPSLLNGDDDISYHSMDGRTQTIVKTRAMMGFILPRVEEIFTFVSEDLRKSTYGDLVGAGGAILTGGGCLLRGTSDAAAQLLEIPVRLGAGHPEQIDSDEGWLAAPYATALGLLHYSTTFHWGDGLGREIGRKKPLWIRRLASLFRDFF